MLTTTLLMCSRVANLGHMTKVDDEAISTHQRIESDGGDVLIAQHKLVVLLRCY